MTITNNTQHESIYYSTSFKGGSVDCGTLKPGEDVVLTSYDNKADVKVTLTVSKTGDETMFIIQDDGL
jgi:ethanolamine utilization microcompartment shell protein EutL